jgi:hypothetical protein
MIRAFLVIAALLVLLPARVLAQGGPPLLTDDPDTPGPGYWEINVAALLEKNHFGRRGDLPRLDFNYGVGRRIQLKFEVPWVSARDVDETHTRSGLGDAVAGVKWRFLGQEGMTIAWSIYPQVAFNTAHSSIANGLVEDGRALLLPTEITLEVAHVEINGEVGRNFVEHGAGDWIYGLSTEGHVRKRLELLAELHDEQSRERDAPADVVANVGAREKLTRQVILLFAAGRRLRGTPEEKGRLLLYAGLQFNVPGLYTFPRPELRRH